MVDWTELRKALLADNSGVTLPSSIKLPILPKALTEFQQKAQDSEASPQELSRIIATDSGLSSELLRLVNSCANGIQRKVTSVQQALVILGIRNSMLYLVTGAMRQAMKSSSSKLIHFQNFWNTNLERSLFAREVAKLLNADADLAFTAGMLQDFLLPLLTNEKFEDYLEFTENRDDYGSLVKFERQKLGWDHALAAAQVMSAWHFPDELVCCVCLHHRGVELLSNPRLGKTSAAAVATSSLLPDALRQESDGLDQLIQLDKEWSEFELLEIANRVDEEFQTVASDVRNHFSFLRVLQKALERIEAEQIEAEA